MTKLYVTERAWQRSINWMYRTYWHDSLLCDVKLSAGWNLAKNFAHTNGITETVIPERAVKVAENFYEENRNLFPNPQSALQLGTSTLFLYALENGDIHYRTNTRTQEHLITHNPRPRDGEVVRRLEDLFATTRNTGRGEHQGGTHASPVRHSVREHLRQLKDGRVVYVRGHERGSGDRPNTITLI